MMTNDKQCVWVRHEASVAYEAGCDGTVFVLAGREPLREKYLLLPALRQTDREVMIIIREPHEKATPDYREYHARVVAAVRANLIRRFGQPTTVDEQEQFDRNVRFFDEQCDYHDEFSEGCDPEDVADENIISADWS